MNVSVVLFTSDLRVHDHPPLRAALGRGGEVVPLFVRDPAVSRVGGTAPNRDAFLADCLAALDAGLRERGGRLVVRSGDPVEEVCAVVREADADIVHMAAGCSGFARRREDRLRHALEADGRRLYVHDAVVTALPSGAVTPAGSDHYAVFTPYFRRWVQERLREPLGAPRVVRMPEGVRSEDLPARADVDGVSDGLAAGGETEGRKRLSAWLARG
ncbi:deoxyribodipyrimidine photo-lyase, partial [Streptomyces sp. SID6041]|nr:deoxyribodipyrimidine photo-lyase [Streptomyces sp. SID6041]